MRLIVVLLVTCSVVVGCTPERSPLTDAQKAGAEVYKQQCAVCHSTFEDEGQTGPHLHGVVGRGVATVATFPYSEAMKNTKQKWTLKNLNMFLKSPLETIPNTQMAYFGLADDDKRSNLVDYLQTLK